MLGLIIALALLGVILIFVTLLSYYAYKSAFWSRGNASQVREYFKKSDFLPLEEKISTLTSFLENDQYENVYIRSYDGLKLHARYYQIKEGAPIQIFMHGYKGNPVRSMCGIYKIAKDNSHNVLLVDQRGCRESEGKAVTFGIKEKRDCLSWVEYISKRFPQSPIFLVGISLGGASVLMANRKTLPDSVVGVVADCPFTSPVEILKKVFYDKKIPKIFFPFIISGAILFAHFNPYSDTATKAVREAKVPILLLHGEKDGFVPISMSEEIYSACTSEKYIYRVKNADHALCSMVDYDGYERATTEFLQKCLNK